MISPDLLAGSPVPLWLLPVAALGGALLAWLVLLGRRAASRALLDQARQQLAGQAAEITALRESTLALERELSQLRATHRERLAAFDDLRAALDEARAMMRTEFHDLAHQVLDEKGRRLSESSQASLDALLRPFREQIEGFQKRVNEVHDASQRGQAQLESEVRRVLDVGLRMSAEASTLASALKGDKKTLGNWGEIQLERSLQLAGLVPGDHYRAQAAFRDEDGLRRHPDFVIHMPDGKHLVLDSKVSLVAYDRAIAAATDDLRAAALAEHVRAVRQHIDDLARKDYSHLIGMRSPGFVLMFMPIEPAWIEAMRHDGALFEYGYQRNVVLVSHTTLMPILRTVANLWMLAQGNEQARALADQAGGVYRQVAIVAERLHRLGQTLGTASTQYNAAVTALAGQQGLYGKVARFREYSMKAGKDLPALGPLHVDLQNERLEGIAGDET